MHARKPLAYPKDVQFLYDGGLCGFYSCVYESVYSHVLPADITPLSTAQPSLFAPKIIATSEERARRVREGIAKKISPRALEMTETVFCSCLGRKEIKLLRFLLLGFMEGRRTDNMLSHPDVVPILRAEKHLWGEQHLLLGFVRFADYDGMLGATITPRNFILPFIAPHFTSRYANEDFLIYDKTHRHALLYERHKSRIVALEDAEFKEASQTELRYQALWKRFYDTIAIEERYNPKCRMTHMPKRYWENMLEMKQLL